MAAALASSRYPRRGFLFLRPIIPGRPSGFFSPTLAMPGMCGLIYVTKSGFSFESEILFEWTPAVDDRNLCPDGIFIVSSSRNYAIRAATTCTYVSTVCNFVHNCTKIHAFGTHSHSPLWSILAKKMATRGNKKPHNHRCRDIPCGKSNHALAANGIYCCPIKIIGIVKKRSISPIGATSPSL